MEGLDLFAGLVDSLFGGMVRDYGTGAVNFALYATIWATCGPE